MSKKRIIIILLASSFLSVLWTTFARADGPEQGWSDPYRLSSEDGKASEAYLVADQYGYVHCFWTESLFASQLTVIKYARFDGTTWTKPNDIYVTSRGIGSLSPYVDRLGMLHLAWSEGLYGPAYYTYAAANDALSAQKWAKPLEIRIPVSTVSLRVDSRGILHLLYINTTEESGVYYIRSENRGITWSEPVWLDPDIPAGHIPASLNFEVDNYDGLHAVWFYGSSEPGAVADWVRYTHSLDGGRTWSIPFTIDRVVEAGDDNLANASPVMIVQDQNVHVIWAAGNPPLRYHRFSTDGGRNWSPPAQIFGDLQGQAFDGLAVDRAGRVHFFGQIRYPMGIYHAYWDQGRWSKPSLIYLVAAQGEDIGNRIHAHYTHPIVRDGNQLVLTFTDPPADPNRRLFVVYRTLDDIPPLATIPTPTPLATPTLPTSPTPTRPAPTSTATAASVSSAGLPPAGQAPQAGLGFRVGLAPVLLLLGGALLYHFWSKHKP